MLSKILKPCPACQRGRVNIIYTYASIQILQSYASIFVKDVY
nr:MAG TPA: restriction alleviation protein [Caudoviricetes sp.]